MTDRDTFAAAALTGFSISLSPGAKYDLELAAKQCYELADAMLRERGTVDRDNCVAANQQEIPCPVTESMPKEKRAEVSDEKPHAYAKHDEKRVDSHTTEEPVAWAVCPRVDDEIDPEFIYADEANAGDVAADCGVVVPLYRHPQPTLTDAEREAVHCFARFGLPDRHAATLRGLLERLK